MKYIPGTYLICYFHLEDKFVKKPTINYVKQDSSGYVGAKQRGV